MQESQSVEPVTSSNTDLLLEPTTNYTRITQQVADIILTPLLKTPRGWLFGFLISATALLLFLYTLGYLVAAGVGLWGVNIPVAWGMDILNFVWWIGIGHAGTLISAILLLFRQEWRTSINRFAEAMTIFAVICAGMYPIFHLGRPWLAYWVLPYPNTMGMWPQFRSPLEWDVFAISTYFTVSLLFWLTGLIPDFATLRDRTDNRVLKYIYGTVALGWRGSAIHWHRYELASLLLAGLSTPLVVSVHSIVSLDFAVAQVPGWNVTIFPPYFVAGAIFAGFAMVLLLMIPLRSYYNLQELITPKHVDVMGKVLLATGMVVAYGYFTEALFAWYSGGEFERFLLIDRATGGYAWAYWSLIFCNVLTPQALWIPRIRRSLPAMLVISLIVSVGMWLERFVIIVISLHRDFLPSSWGWYTPSFWDWMFYIGTFGIFFTGMFLFIRAMPSIAIFEVRSLFYKYRENRGNSGEVQGFAPITKDVTQ
ncbi:MAG TPA: NrfD/PsrC family molybdoenzyme membrane anchor subunit [Roseiflexaceae bacterium]|nr:NrfD/PsrC family molybdoenzyme membrane anchor subunit [Roseiflexaceae bacterium]